MLCSDLMRSKEAPSCGQWISTDEVFTHLLLLVGAASSWTWGGWGGALTFASAMRQTHLLTSWSRLWGRGLVGRCRGLLRESWACRATVQGSECLWGITRVWISCCGEQVRDNSKGYISTCPHGPLQLLKERCGSHSTVCFLPRGRWSPAPRLWFTRTLLLVLTGHHFEITQVDYHCGSLQIFLSLFSPSVSGI